MICPVPTYGYSACSNSIMFTVDGTDTTATKIYGFGGRSVKAIPDKATLSLLIANNYILNQTRNFLYNNNTFAVYIEHLGRIAWHVVRHSGAGIEFTRDGSIHKATITVHVLAYTYTGIPMASLEPIVDDNGNPVVDDHGNKIYSDLTPGEATGCIKL